MNKQAIDEKADSIEPNTHRRDHSELTMRHLTIFSISLFLGGACSAPAPKAERSFIETTESIRYLELVVNNYPDSADAVIARNRLEILKEQDAWDKAIRKGSINGFRTYLNQYGQGANAEHARARVLSLQAQGVLPRYKALGTTEGWRAFLAQYDQTPEAEIAREALDTLHKRNERLRQAKTVRLVTSYQEKNQAQPLPPILVDAVSEILRIQGYKLVDSSEADLLISIDASGDSSGFRYLGGTIRHNSRAQFNAVIEVRERDNVLLQTTSAGHTTSIPYMLPVGRRHMHLLDAGLSGEDAGVNSNLVRTFAELAYEVHGSSRLVSAMQSDVPLVGNAAMLAMQNRMTPQDIEVTRMLLGHSDVGVQQLAVFALQPHWHPDGTAPEAERLSYYLFADWSTGNIQNMYTFTEASLPRASTIAESEGSPERRAIMLLSALGHSGLGELVELVERGRVTPSVVFRSAFQRAGNKGIVALQPLLRHEQSKVRREAKKILQDIKPDNFSELIGFLQVSEPNQSDDIESAIEALGWHGDQSAIPYLKDLLQSEGLSYTLEKNAQQAIARLQAFGRQ